MWRLFILRRLLLFLEEHPELQKHYEDFAPYANWEKFREYLIKETNFLKRFDNKKRRILINQTIENGIKKGYLNVKEDRFSNIIGISLTSIGKDFTEKTYFLNTILQEFGYIVSFFFGGFGGITIVWLLNLTWSEVKKHF